MRLNEPKGVILDVSGLDVIDQEDFNSLRQTLMMSEVMGAQTVISGLNAGVVSALIELQVDTKGMEGARDLDDAFEMIELLRADDIGDSEGDGGT